MRFPLTVVPAPQVRRCGGCTACCASMGVREFGKPMWAVCQHREGDGCGIYQDRPASCREFECLWKQGNLEGDERRRPDNLGLMFTAVNNATIPTVAAWEVIPGALERNHFLLSKMAERLLVYCIPHGEKTRRRLMAPKHLEEQIKVVLEKAYDGQEVEENW